MQKTLFNHARMLAMGVVMMLITACAGSQVTWKNNHANQEPPGTTSSTVLLDETGGTLELTTAKPEKLSGVYQREGIGIRFLSAKSDENIEFSLQTLDGQDLIQADGDGSELKITSMGKYSEAAKYADLREVMATAPETNSSQPKMSLALRVKGDREAAAQVNNQKEMSLLPWLARALGQFGYYGKTHPAAMPLLMMGRSLAERRSVEIPTLVKPEGLKLEDHSAEAAAHQLPEGDKNYSEGPERSIWNCGGHPQGFSGTWSTSCLLGNCPGSTNCLGMCGPKCTCWWYVCGDCCAHVGCYVHDNLCGPNVYWCTVNFWQFFIGGCTPMWGLS